MHIGNRNSSGRRGQSLIEILVALGLGIILIGGVTALITVNLRSSTESKVTQAASSLTQEVIDAAKSKAEGDWNAFYALGKTSENKYHIASSTLEVTSGTESLILGEYVFTRYFYIENVNRTECGVGSPTAAAVSAECTNFSAGAGFVAEDPSTQKITVVVEWANGGSVKQEQYVSRTHNVAIRQTDWSGGGGDNSILTNPNNKYATASSIDAGTTPGAIKVILSGGGGGGLATPNIDGTEPNHWAWNDIIGWIDFGYAAGGVGVNNDKLFGYASSSIGLIAFDCATTPNGDICAGAGGNWKVSNVGSALKGWAYNDAIGWISFDSVSATSSTSYGVSILGDGSLSGYAWNDAIGWISFNCANAGTCAPGGYDYRVKTSWVATPDSGSLTSPIFDLGKSAVVNSVIWKGLANGGSVRFQVAASGVSNPASWNYKGPDGTSGTTYNTGGPDVSTVVSPRDFSNVRYIRYKVFIDSDAGRTNSPEVRDIILSYSL